MDEKVKISITIDEALLKAIDKKRGLVKRSTFIEKILREWVEKAQASH